MRHMNQLVGIAVCNACVVAACGVGHNFERAVTGYGGILLSNIKSPIVVDVTGSGMGSPLHSEPFAQLLELDRAGSLPPRIGSQYEESESVETFADFATPLRRSDPPAEDTLVAVAISGGGSRAAVFAAYTMELLERKYNAECARVYARCAPFVSLLDAFSTVSGGSLYTFFVIREMRDAHATAKQGGQDAYKELFHNTRDRRRTGLENLGRWTFHSYLGGDFGGHAVAGLWPVSWAKDLFTNVSYRDYLIKGLDFGGYCETYGLKSRAPRLSFRDIAGWSEATTPRFYFNATALETGAPFVLTSRITNLRPVELPRRTARLDAPVDACETELPTSAEACHVRQQRPLFHSLTLEDIGNSPSEMSVAKAAIASAAFPFAVEPVPMRHYYLRRAERSVQPTRTITQLVDGGVYDNSGMTTAVDLFQYLAKYRKVRHLVLIAINADAERRIESYEEVSTDGPVAVPLDFGLPLPTLISGAASLGSIHYSNKRRAEQGDWGRLETLAFELTGRMRPEALRFRLEACERYGSPGRAACIVHSKDIADAMAGFPDLLSTAATGTLSASEVVSGYARRVVAENVHFFPVDISQLSASDPHAIPGGDSYFEAAAPLQTTFWTQERDAAILQEAAARILSAPQSRHEWNVGCNAGGVARLDEAVAYAVMRASQERWQDALPCDGIMPR